MYQVLARQWRPKNFHELVGQAHVAEALAYALDHDRIHHAHLFTGTRGVGKTTIARIFAKSLNCLTNGVSSKPCGTCEHCTEIDAGRFPDLIEVDAASRTGVDDTRDLLDNVPYAPVKGRYKVYLIDEVHMFSKSSFNALLKTLEEPPPHVKFILATTDLQKVPATVLSRCLQFHLKNLTPRQIAGHLANILRHEQTPFDDEALAMLARAGNGSMRDALSLLDQAIAFGQGEVRTAKVAGLLGAVPARHFIALMEAMAHQDAAGLRRILAEMDEYAPDYAALLAELMGQFQRVTVLQLGAAQPDEYFEPELAALAGRLPVELMQLWYQIATDTWQYFPYQPSAGLAFEMMLLRMTAMQPLFPNAPPRAVADLARGGDETLQRAAQIGHPQENAPAVRPEAQAPEAVAHSAVPPVGDIPPFADAPPWEDEAPAPPESHMGDLQAESVPDYLAAPPMGNEADEQAQMPANAGVPENALPQHSENTLVAGDLSPSGPAAMPVAADRQAQPDGHAADAAPANESAAQSAAAPYAENAAQTSAPAADADLPPLPDLAATVGDVGAWAAFVRHLPKDGKVRLFADNGCPIDWQPPRLTLQVPFMMTGFDDGRRVQALAEAVAALCGMPCEIVLAVHDEVITPGKWRSQAKEAEQVRAEQAFYEHGLTRALQERLDAKVRAQSIQSMKTQTE